MSAPPDSHVEPVASAESPTVRADGVIVPEATDTTATTTDAPPPPTRRPSNARNVLANWAAQLVTVISGFFLPRLISDHMGPAQLGVWDFGWSMGNLITLTQFGIGSNTVYHAARYQATGEWDKLNRILSSTLSLIFISISFGVVVTIGVMSVAPYIMKAETPELVRSAQWMIAAMGCVMAFKMLNHVYGGMIVAAHRFDIVTRVEIACDVAMVCMFLVAVLAGWGLKPMAVCIAGRHLAELLGKQWIAHRMFPRLRLRPNLRDRSDFKELLGYGGKTVAEAVSSIVLNQIMLAMVMGFCGAVKVAQFSRPIALLRNVSRFVLGYARLLVPQAAEIHGRGDQRRMAQLLIESARVSLYLVLPMVVLFFVMGGPLMHVWMGKGYDDPWLLGIFTLGYLPFFVQRSTWHILMGVGSHGSASLVSLLSVAASILLGLLFLGVFQMGIHAAAWAVVAPMLIVNVWFFPRAGCKVAGISLSRYYIEGYLPALPVVVPYAIVLVLVRLFVHHSPLVELLTGLVLSGLALAIMYWRYVLNDSHKERVLSRFGRWSGRGAAGPA